jgi:hypothetical protein
MSNEDIHDFNSIARRMGKYRLFFDVCSDRPER